MASLQEQLLKAGVVDKSKAKKIQKEKRKQAAQQPKGQVKIDEAKEAAKRALAEKVAADKERSRLQNEEAEKKALRAQIVQIVSLNKVSRDNGEATYQFTDGKKIKKIYVTEALKKQLSVGNLAIAKLDERYELVPSGIAEKITARDASVIVSHHVSTNDTIDEDDPYAAYQIPDDLDW